MAVVPFMGDGVPDTAEPLASVVEVAEWLLERAQAGEIQALGCVYMHANRTAGFRTAGYLGGYSIIGATDVMRHHLIEQAAE
jgi:hypothetical protein